MGYVSDFSLVELPVVRSEDHFAAIFSSNLKIAEAGTYRFRLSSDDGSRLIIDNKCVADNDGSHSFNPVVGTIQLDKGSHIIKVEYFEDTDGQELSLEFALGDAPFRPVLPKDLEK